MSELASMSMAWVSQKLRVLGATVNADRWVPSSWITTTEFLVVAIMAPGLVVLVAWMGSALGLSVPLSQVAATILGLACVSPFMLRLMQYSTSPESGDTLFTAPTLLAPDAQSNSATQDYEGWYGQMENSLSELSAEQVELIIDLLSAYQDTDLTQVEWARVASSLDILDARLEELDA